MNRLTDKKDREVSFYFSEKNILPSLRVIEEIKILFVAADFTSTSLITLTTTMKKRLKNLNCNLHS